MQRIQFLLILIVLAASAGYAAHGNAGTLELKDTSEVVNKALGLYQSQDFAGAIELLEPVTKSEPENGRAGLVLGLAFHSMGDLDKAHEAHMKAVEVEETSVRAMYNVSNLGSQRQQ